MKGQKKVEGMELLVPYRETLYGSKELWLQEPGGHIIGSEGIQQFLGGPGEAAAAGHSEKDAELVKREPANICHAI